jgi:TatA/E family protein of Tat protein translocase
MSPFLPFGFLVDSLGVGEILLVFVVVLLLFGPRRLPEIARSIGRTMESLRRASRDFQDQFMNIDREPPPPRPLPASPAPEPESPPPAEAAEEEELPPTAPEPEANQPPGEGEPDERAG